MVYFKVFKGETISFRGSNGVWEVTMLLPTCVDTYWGLYCRVTPSGIDPGAFCSRICSKSVFDPAA